jgi:hypothetical protein
MPPDNGPHMQQRVSQGINKPMPNQWKRIGPLDTSSRPLRAGGLPDRGNDSDHQQLLASLRISALVERRDFAGDSIHN